MNDLFKDRAKEYFGVDTSRFLKLLNDKPTQGFFINTLKGNKNDILDLIDFKYNKSDFNENGYYHSNDNIGKSIAYELGLIYPQDVESSFSSSFINDDNINLIVDLCSAPGGKAINIINKYKDAICICNDVNSSRALELAKNLERLGLTKTVITNKNPKDLVNSLKGNADLVILDAPCSGEGMIRKYPEILDYYSLKNIESLSKIQKSLLEDSYNLINKNGYILYSTCTYAYEEDENQIKQFLDSHNDMELIKIDCINNYSKLPGTIKLCPLSNCEGQFISLLKRTSSNEMKNIGHIKNEKNNIVEKFIKDNLNIEKYYLYSVDDNYYMSEFLPLDLNKGIIRQGIYLGQLKKDRFEPAHNMYRSIYLFNKYNHSYELNDEQYLKYIQGYEIVADLTNNYYLLTYKGYSVGFAKASNGTLKNKYPKGLRRVC